MAKTSIVILSYNTYKLTKECIESIRQYTAPGSYEIIVVDNASIDESQTWLKKQSDIKLLINTENVGFPRGCNQGAALAEAENDILFLNSDTVVTARWLENMQIALYSGGKVGAVGCVTNNCSNGQQVKLEYDDLQSMQAATDRFNQSNPNRWMLKPKLVGFCMLIKRTAWNEVGMLDEAFSPGNYEDDDYSLRLIMKGYKLFLCTDTFIHHYGSASFISSKTKKQVIEYNKLLLKNRTYFEKKWGVSSFYANMHSVINEVQIAKVASKRICVIGCRAGHDLCLLRWKYPHTQLSGVTDVYREAELAEQYFDVKYCSDLERYADEYLTGQYDYILIARAEADFVDFAAFVDKLMPFLAPEGSIHVNDRPEEY